MERRRNAGRDFLGACDSEQPRISLRSSGLRLLATATGAPAKSLIRMFGPRGNPQAKNLFAVIGYLQKKAGLHLRVAA